MIGNGSEKMGEEREIDIFVTNKCNSNCIMCPMSEGSRRKNNPEHIEELKAYIRELPKDMEYINVTGGEPTLAGKDFLEIMHMLKEKFQHSGFQLLTNGRSAADNNFLNAMLKEMPDGIRYAIPLHCSREEVHDSITQVKGSFRQTICGISNLLKHDAKVEIRIVVSSRNIEYLKDTAKFIVEHFPGVFCVNFVAMEMMGNAAKNREILWVDYAEVFKKARAAIEILVTSGIDVQLYNFPLCAVEHDYWRLAAKSITEYKIRYMEACDECSVKPICGGFFVSTQKVMHPEVHPVKEVKR